MSHEFDRFDPSAWQDDGIVTTARRAADKSQARRDKPWVATLFAATVSVVGTIGMALSPSSAALSAVTSSTSSLRSTVILACVPKDKADDPDYVDPSYWAHVGRYLNSLPPFPEESEGELPDLPDLSS